MKIINHSAFNFRNLDSINISPDSEMNILYGENGQGKTNIIESIWMMTGFYSFRARKNIQLIKQGEKESVIKSEFYSKGREQIAEMRIGQKKELFLNEIKEDSPRAILGTYTAVVFSPNTLGIVQDGPSERRKLLDVAISLVKPNYALIMSKYLRVLEQRNTLIRKFGQDSNKYAAYFEPWNNELINLGSKIVRYRLDYIDLLSKSSSEIYDGISSGREKFGFYYDFARENISDEEIKSKLTNELNKNFESDIKRQYTGTGPHLHDLVLNIDGKDARIFGSRGQQRSCALSVKLAEATIIEKIAGECPVVLLDDVMSELDEGRQKFILNYLDNWQVFITCCDPSTLLRSGKGKIFEVSAGKVKEVN